MELTKQSCVPCEGGVPRLTVDEARALLPQVPGWRIVDSEKKLTRTFTFSDFKQAMAFVNRIAELAESENHHPDIAVRYNAVDLVVYTHTIAGLSMNDFVLAAKANLVVL